MTSVTKTKLGRWGFQSRGSVKSDPSVGPNGSKTLNRVIVQAGTVLYVPYAVPGWKQKIANAQDATSLLQGNELHVEKSKPFKYRVLNGYPGNKLRDAVGSGDLLSLVNPPGPYPPTDVKAVALAAEAFVADYYSKTRSIRGASSAAEFVSTVRGLASPAKALRKEVSMLYNSLRGRVRRSNARGARDMADVIGGTWLEWQFGIKPLVDDVNGAADAVNRIKNGDFRGTIPIRGVNSQSSNIGSFMNNTLGSGLSGLETNFGVYDVHEYDETICVFRGAVKIGTSGGDVPPVMQFGVGFEDILPAVWEAIPWSFFVDYFINVSSVIDALSIAKSRFAYVNRTVRNRRVRVFSDVRPLKDDVFGDFFSRHTASGGGVKCYNQYVLRSIVDWRDFIPGLRIKLPGLGTKWANIAALATMYRPPVEEHEWLSGRRLTRQARRARW
jgi:hypothetical protein